MERIYWNEICGTLKHLGSGASKECYAIDENLVVKVSIQHQDRIYKNPCNYNCFTCSIDCDNRSYTYDKCFDIDQIEQENEVWQEYGSDYKDILAEIYDYYEDSEGRKYIIAERLTPLNYFRYDEIATKVSGSADNVPEYCGDLEELFYAIDKDWMNRVVGLWNILGFWTGEAVSERNMGFTKDFKPKILDYGL